MEIKEAVKLARENNNEGYAYLYENTYQKGYYVALKYMKDEDRAIDVLQDAYVRAFKYIGQLDEADKFPAWFARIVATTALNELKKKSPILFSQMEDEEGNSEVDNFYDEREEYQPEVTLDKAETRRLVNEIIDTLSDEQRICITMFYMEEMSVKEMAEVLGVSENTVKSRLNYGRQKIKDKVLELEKKGTKLYGVAPIPFLLWLLRSDVLAQEINGKLYQKVAANIGQQVGKKILFKSTEKVVDGAAKQKIIWASIFGGTTLVAAVAMFVVVVQGRNMPKPDIPVEIIKPFPIIEKQMLEVPEPEPQEPETQEPEIQETEEPEPEPQEPETQGSETQESETSESKPQEPEPEETKENKKKEEETKNTEKAKEETPKEEKEEKKEEIPATSNDEDDEVEIEVGEDDGEDEDSGDVNIEVE